MASFVAFDNKEPSFITRRDYNVAKIEYLSMDNIRYFLRFT